MLSVVYLVAEQLQKNAEKHLPRHPRPISPRLKHCPSARPIDQLTNQPINQSFRQRVRLTYAKTEAMRYTGHLDVQRTLERMFRRAGLPLWHSQGYHPRPKMHLAAALPLGCTSEHEIADFWLTEPWPAEKIAAALRRAAPPGLRILAVTLPDPAEPPLPTQVRSSDYLVTLLDPVPDLVEKVRALLAASSLPRERRGKPYDLRPLVESLDVLSPDGEGHQRLVMRLRAQEGATGRPDEVLAALGIPLNAARIHRTGLILRNPTGKPP